MALPPKFPAAKTLGVRIAKRRAELGLSQMALAELAQTHFTYISDAERGQRNISLLMILKLADALKMNAGELLEGLHAPRPRR